MKKDYPRKYKARKPRNYSALTFAISLIVSFCILGGFYMLMLTYQRDKLASEEQEGVPYSGDNRSDYHPGKGESLTLLLLGVSEPASLPEISALFYYNAPQGSLSIITLPAATVCENKAGRIDSLRGHYDYEGLAGGVNAINGLFSIESEKYIRMQKIGFANMTDFFGGLPHETESGEEILLDGRRLSDMIFAEAAKPHTSNPAVQAELMSLLLKKGFTSTLLPQYEAFINAVFYNAETNLNQTDLARRQTGFLSRIKQDSLIIKNYTLKGKYNSDYSAFYPNEESLKEIKEVLAR